jgi:hypothetical protein
LGALGSLGLVLVLELSLGFMVLSPVPGALEVSVVEPVWVVSTGPVEGAAGRVRSMLEPLVPPVVELLESVVLLAAPDVLLSRPSSRGVLVSLEVGLRIELSVGLRPLARRFDLIFVPSWLQSHLHLSSFPIVSVEDAMPPVRVEAPAWGIVLSVGDAVSLLVDALVESEVLVDDEVDIDPRSDVLLPAVAPACGIVLSVGEAVSFFVDCVVELGRSSVVCADTAGAASASARIEVAASFIGCLRQGFNVP